jgi:hypothetical protein
LPRNAAGQITSVSRDNDGYAWTGHYVVNRPYVTNGLNQYTSTGGPTFAYDANGNLTSDGVHGFTYDIGSPFATGSGAGRGVRTRLPAPPGPRAGSRSSR